MKILLISLTCFTLLFTSCKKDDIEPIYEDLENAYIESVTIINVPPYYWDNGSSPDLQLGLALETSLSWTYITDRVDNVEKVPEQLSFTEDIKITDENWELELFDYDDLNENDMIYRIIFNPMDNAAGGKIPIYNNDLLVLEFNYTQK